MTKTNVATNCRHLLRHTSRLTANHIGHFLSCEEYVFSAHPFSRCGRRQRRTRARETPDQRACCLRATSNAVEFRAACVVCLTVPPALTGGVTSFRRQRTVGVYDFVARTANARFRLAGRTILSPKCLAACQAMLFIGPQNWGHFKR